MSTVIDNRVVDMQFNNAQFERGASQTISTLEKLKEGLKFKDGTKGMEEIQNGADRLNFNGIADALAITSRKFSLLEIAGITAFTNIVNKGVNLLESKIKELTVGQVTSGWNKYAEKTSAVQTIMAATAKDFDDTAEHMSYVNDQLSKLNWFTDETSFNFLDMVNNIGKFTANQIPLEQSVTAMEGISTWAAVSGANIGEAGRAMYNLSQAIAVGSVKLMDWKSIENANMATAEFKETVIQTALEMGTLEKKGDKVFVKGNKKALVSVKNFNAELSKGWFSSEVLLKSLDKYGAFTNKLYEFSDKTGLIASDILDIIDRYRDGSASILDIMNELGDTELTSKEVKKMLDGLTDSSMALGEKAFRAAQEAKTFQEAIDSVKDAVSTGWMQTFELIFGNYEQAKGLWTTVANELYDLFAESGNKRNELLEQWNELGGRDILLDSMKNAWNGFRNVLDLVGESFRNIFPETTVDDLMNFTNKLNEATETFLNFVKVRDKKPTEVNKDSKGLKRINAGGNSFSDGFEAENKEIDATQRRLDNLSKTATGFFAAIDIVGRALGAVANIIGRFVGYLVPAADGIADITGSFGDWIVALDESIKENGTFENAIQKVDPIIRKVADAVSFAVGILKKGIGIFTGFFKKSGEAVDSFSEKTEKRLTPIKALGEIFSAVFERIKIILAPFKAMLPKAMDSFSGSLEKMHEGLVKNIKEGNFKNLLDIFNSGIFAIVAKKIYDFVKGFGNIGKSVKDFKKEVIEAIGKITESLSGGDSKADDLLKIAGAIGILAGSLFLLSSVDSKSLFMALLAMTALVSAVGFLLDKLSDDSGPQKFEKWSDAFGNFGKSIAQSKKIDSLTSGLLKVAIAVGILSISLISLASLSWEEMFKGLVGVIALTGTMLIVAYALSKMNGNLTKGLSGLVMMATAVKILTDAVAALGTLNSEENPEALMQGIGGVLTLIAALAVFTKVAGKMNVNTGVAFVALAASLLIIVRAIESLSEMSSKGLLKGVGTITAILAVIAAFSALMSSKYVKGGKAFAAANAVLVMSVAMLIMGKAIKNIGSLDTDQIVKGMAAIVGGLSAMATASLIISQSGASGALSVLAFSVAFIALAAALKIIAAIPLNGLIQAVIAFTAILTVIGIAGAVLTPAMAGTILMISAAFLVFGLGMITVSAGLTALSGALIAFSASLPIIGASLINGFLVIVSSILDVIGTLSIKIVGVVVNLLMAFLGAVAFNIDIIVASAILIVVNFLKGIIEMLPVVVDTILRLIVVIIITVAQAIDRYGPAILGAIWALVLSIWNLLLEAVAAVLEAIPVFGDTAANAVRGWKANVDGAAENAFSGLPEAAEASVNKTEKIVDNGQNDMINNLYARASDGKNAATNFTEATSVGFKGITDYAEKYGMEGVDAFSTTLVNGKPQAEAAGGELKNAAAGAVEDRSAFEDAGKNNVQGYIHGILSRKAEAAGATVAVAQASLNSMRTALAEKSPSKKTFKIGDFLTIGFANGIVDKIKKVKENSTKLGKTALNAVKDAVSTTSDIINRDVDLSPRITPVVDLDDVQQGVCVLDGLLNNRSYSFAADASVRFDRNRMAEMEQQIAESSALNDALKSVNDKLEQFNNSGNYHFETPVVLNGREIARGTAEFTREELNKLDRLNNRKGGRV